MPAAKRKTNTEAAPALRVLPDPAPSAPSGVKKLSLGGLIKTTTERKSDHPLIVQPSAELIETLELFAVESPKFKALKGTVEALSKSAGLLGKPFWFNHWQKRGDASSTMLVNLPSGKQARLVFKNAYTSKLTDDAPLVALLGDRAGAHFRQATELKIKLDEIPESLHEPLTIGILELAAQLGITGGIEAKQCIKPCPGIHEQRHTLFTPEENMAIDEILPITAYPQV